jgi:hypothetical protein
MVLLFLVSVAVDPAFVLSQASLQSQAPLLLMVSLLLMLSMHAVSKHSL